MPRSKRIKPGKKWKKGDLIRPRRLLCDFNGKKTGQCENVATDPVYTRPIKDWVGRNDSGQPRWVCSKHAKMLRRMGKEVNIHTGAPAKDDPPPLPPPQEKNLRKVVKKKKPVTKKKVTRPKVKGRR